MGVLTSRRLVDSCEYDLGVLWTIPRLLIEWFVPDMGLTALCPKRVKFVLRRPFRDQCENTGNSKQCTSYQVVTCVRSLRRQVQYDKELGRRAHEPRAQSTRYCCLNYRNNTVCLCSVLQTSTIRALRTDVRTCLVSYNSSTAAEPWVVAVYCCCTAVPGTGRWCQ